MHAASAQANYPPGQAPEDGKPWALAGVWFLWGESLRERQREGWRRSTRSLRALAGTALSIALLLAAIVFGTAQRPPSATAEPGILSRGHGAHALAAPFGDAKVEATPAASLIAPRLASVPSLESIAADIVRVAPDDGSVAIEELPLHIPPDTIVASGILTSGQTLAAALGAQGIPAATVHVIARELRPVYDFRRAQPGHEFRLVTMAEGDILDFRYSLSPTESFHLFPADEGQRFVVRREEAELEAEVARIAGVVASSLYQSVRKLGEDPQLASAFAALFAWDVDFSRRVRKGDAFQIVYERLHRVSADGERRYVRLGRILAARYSGAEGNFETVYFQAGEGEPGGYYRPDGTSVERAFLAAPLRYSRVTSSYSRARRHPILKVTRPHLGIDYAAPRGTPVWAVAGGTVTYRGWGGSFGNLVKVLHANGYTSYYSHLSGFAKGLTSGSAVEQKQVIGYVGSTGLATGPHVCFRIAKNGVYVNPLRVGSPAGSPVTPTSFARFETTRDSLLARLDGSIVVAMDAR